MEKMVVTPNEVARLLSISPNDVYKLLESGEIRAYRHRSRWKIPVKSLDEYIDRQVEMERRSE